MNKLDSTQLEQLRAIGAYLYEVRQAQSRTLEEIAAKTYIPLRLLKALEAGHDQALPEPVFVQGFIRRYADALGLDGLELAQAFPLTSTTEPEPRPDSFDPSLANLGSTAASEAALPQGFSMLRSHRSSRSWLASGAIALAILGGLVYLLSRLGSQPDPVAEQPVAEQPPSVSPSSTPSPIPASPTVSALVSPVPAVNPSPADTTPVKVEVNLTADSWLEVTVDGEVELSETLPRGTKRSWSAEQSVTIVAGNAGGVQVAFNQAKAQPMGNLGAVAERTFTAKKE